MQLSRLLFAFALLALLPSPARADDTAGAREHYRQGTKLFDLRRYREAAREYELAYEAKEDAALLFNIAQAYRLAGAYEESVASYRSFLRRVPKTSNRAEVQQRIAEMQEILSAQRKQQDAPPEGTFTPHETPRAPEPAIATAPPIAAPLSGPSDAALAAAHKKKLAGVALAAVGVAAIAVGATFAVLARQASDQVTHAKQDQPFDPAVERRGKVGQAVGISGLAVGGAALAGGVALWLIGRHESRRSSLVLAPVVGPGRAGVLVELGF